MIGNGRRVVADRVRSVPDLLAIGALLFGVKLVVINAFGSDVPFWDQWDAEGRNLLIPYLARGPSAVDWLAPHNLHRILTTRLFALAVFVANGQWDALVECVFAALLHVACALALAVFVGRMYPAASARMALIPVIVVGFAAPYGWSNTIGGFQCQFYFLELATLAMLFIASRADKTPTALAAIVALGLVAYFSLAGGVMSCVATAFVVGWMAIGSPRPARRRAEWICVVGLLALASAGYLLTPNIEPATGTEGRAIGFIEALDQCLSFPTTAGAIVLWSPCAVLLFRVARLPARTTRGSAFSLGLGLFVVLIAAGIASQRGGDVASRYTDLLWLGLFANLLALHDLAGIEAFAASRPWWRAAFIGYAFTIAALLVNDGLDRLDQAAGHKREMDIAAVNLASFVRTGDIAALRAKRPDEIGHPSALLVGLVLENESIRAILPPSIRPGLLEGVDRIASSDFAFPGIALPDPGRPTAPVSTDDRPATAGMTRLVSRPLVPFGHGPIAIRVIGTAPRAQLAATLTDRDGERRPFAFRGINAGRWTTIVVSPPPAPFVFSFVRIGREQGQTVAFSGPFEIGRLRRTCDFLLAHGNAMVAAGAAAFLLLVRGRRAIPSD